MLEQFREAIAVAANLDQLDKLAKRAADAWGRGEIDGAAYEACTEAVQARQIAFARPPVGVRPGIAFAARARRLRPRSADRQASLERRRRQAASGTVPPQIAALFTQGEAAVLAVIGRQCAEAGACDWCVDRIAALAGVSASTVKRAIRHAEEAGLIRREQRRIRYDLSLPSKLTVISPEWKAWLARGPKPVAGQKKSATITDSYYWQSARRATREGYREEAEGAHGRPQPAGPRSRRAA